MDDFQIIGLIIITFLVLITAGTWKVFQKANKPGWASIIPIYNVAILLEVAKLPSAYVMLYFIPYINVVLNFYVSIKVAKAFSKNIIFGLGLGAFPFIFYPILGFGKDQYKFNQPENSDSTPTPENYPNSIV